MRDITATILKLGGVEIPANMDAQPIPDLEWRDASPRERIFGFLRGGWMVFDGRWKLCRYYAGSGPLLYDLKNDPRELDNGANDPANRDTLNQLDAELNREIMDSIEQAMHDRLPAPHSLALDVPFGMEGWHWQFPAPAPEAVKVGWDAQ